MNSKKISEKLQTTGAIKWLWIILLGPFVLVLLLLLLVSTGIFGRMPSFAALENPKSNLATEIYSEDGVMIGSFFIHNRLYVDYADLSPNLVAALVSTEDERFYSHSGIDFISLARVGIKTLALGRKNQGGGSTLSQQVAKNLFPRDTVVYRSPVVKVPRMVITKLKEWVTAVKLEHNYTKEEIIAMYLNVAEFGSNAYGIRSASYTFFNKAPSDLNIQEAAMLVGVVNAPTRYSPVRNYNNALARRNTVIERMWKNNYITKVQRDSIQLLPIELEYSPISHSQGMATYFRTMLSLVMTSRRPTRGQLPNDWDYEQWVKRWDENPIYGWAVKNRKADGTPYDIYRDGLKIYTTINASMQQYAEEALYNQLANEVQPRMEAQYNRTRVLFNDISNDEIERIIRNAMRYTERYRDLMERGASQEEVDKDFNTPVEMRLFGYNGGIDTVMTPRDSILYHKRIMRASFVAMDPSNGYVKAYVGGPDFRYFQYDMVTQGRRQVGSAIKPFVYTFAIDQLGLSPCTLVPNLLTVVENVTGVPWAPSEASSNYEYDGVLHPLYWGLANSRNNYSAWIMKQAKQPAALADLIHRMGIMSWLDPVYALALGTPDVSLYEMVGAYGTFVNRGVFNEPIFVTRIEDRQGNLLATFTNSSHDAISEQTAYTMLEMLKNVVDAGTAGRLRRVYGFTGEIGGKTGTSQNSSDAWFIGVTPKLVAGGWVGGEDRSIRLLTGAEGASMALPIFGEFMKRVYADPRLGIYQNDMFTRPLGVISYDCNTEDARLQHYDQFTNDEFFD